jgi:Xaa-Pro aminopeptidase
MAQLRIRKEPGEVERLRRAGAAADRVALRLREERFSGRTERELARIVAEMTVDEGHDLAAFSIVAAGPDGASPHHEPGDRVVAAGDAVVVDFGGSLDGYHSDTTRCFHVGPPSAAVLAVHEVVRQAQEAGVAAVAPGVAAEEIDRAARDVIEDAGYGDAFIHRTGHGIGLEVHEEPYLVAGNDQILDTGMAFSVEPGIYLPGSFGIRIEDIVVVGDAGAERLNESRRDLGIVA